MIPMILTSIVSGTVLHLIFRTSSTAHSLGLHAFGFSLIIGMHQFQYSINRHFNHLMRNIAKDAGESGAQILVSIGLQIAFIEPILRIFQHLPNTSFAFKQLRLIELQFFQDFIGRCPFLQELILARKQRSRTGESSVHNHQKASAE